ELDDPVRIGMPKGVDALVVVTCDKEHRPVRTKQPNELLIAGVQVLELVDDQVLDGGQLRSLQGSLLHCIHTLVDDLPRENAAIEVCPSGVERVEGLDFGGCDLCLVYVLRVQRLPLSVVC